MTKKHLNTLINLANRFENLEEDKDLLLAKLKSFLKTLDKHELEELSDDLKQFPEAGEVAALLREIAAKNEEVHASQGQHRGAKGLRRFSLITQSLQFERCQSALGIERLPFAKSMPKRRSCGTRPNWAMELRQP